MTYTNKTKQIATASVIGVAATAFAAYLAIKDYNTPNKYAQTNANTHAVTPAVSKTTPDGVTVPTDAPKQWQQQAQKPTAWVYDSQHDDMRNQTTYAAYTTSTNSLNFSFPYSGGSTAQLYLRQSPKYGNDIYLTISKGQFYCTSYDGCTIHAKFDNGPVIALHASAATGGDTTTIFISGFKRFSDRLKSAKHLFVEAEFYQEGQRQMEFDVSGFEGIKPASGKN